MRNEKLNGPKSCLPKHMLLIILFIISSKFMVIYYGNKLMKSSEYVHTKSTWAFDSNESNVFPIYVIY